jgi:hypothetical protein
MCDNLEVLRTLDATNFGILEGVWCRGGHVIFLWPAAADRAADRPSD